ncbi:alaserpin-like isoform X2 [Zootermopsis nevadensis]|uniref:alaserpin-like isoform X2 n=1 Tax=Zootermopsis nevadensis TaxID=136037 RepID=UPI000B8E54E5|nr:alaserpin-like isoform X2 [Zootermopsis nevadensis]
MWPATLCFILGTLYLSRAQSSNTAISKQSADAVDNFSVNLFKAVFNNNGGNAVVSPVSVSTLLAIIQQGSGGNTLAQLTQVLYLNQEQSKETYGQLTRNLKDSSGNATLEFANAAFVEEGYPIKPEFSRVMVQDFQSSVLTAQFSEPVEAAAEINSWVANHTHDKIQELISPKSLDSSTRLVLVNAIFFKGFWKTLFWKNRTTNDAFFTKPYTSKLVPTMHLETKLLTGDLEDLDARWLQLPFEGDQYYLLIILPNKIDGVDSVVNSITGSEFSDLLDNLDSRGWNRTVVLSLPKFKLETTLQLIPTLKEIGLTDIFSPGANLSGISGESLYVSEVVQKAEIEVDEEGATAVAATAVIGAHPTAVIANPPPVVFTVDHPFLAFLVEEHDKIPLFASRVIDPTTS